MSGIAGIFHLDTCTVSRSDVEAMTQRLAHRGPDASAVWTGGCTGLGHTLRHTTPESLAERQPLCGAGGLYVLTADARLDNREALMRALGWRERPAETPDSALILAAYQRWGTACLDHLLGAFAFALWDARSRTLFCARDHFGLKPLYYAHAGKAFAFASEIKALLTLPRVSRQINQTSIADYLMLMVEDKVSTFYEAVRRLPPAHYLRVTPQGVARTPYWALDAAREVVYESDEAYAEAYRAHFVEAVRCRLRSAFPVGTMLSGGLDSSSITCVARSLLGADEAHPLDTFSLVFEDVAASDERPYIEAVRAQGGLRSHEVLGDRLGVLDDIDRMLWHLDEPFLGPNLFLHWGLYEAARQHGVRVVLDGLLGDSVVFHAGCYLTELAVRGRWLRLAHEVWATAGVLARRSKQRKAKLVQQLLRKYVVSPLVAEPLRQVRFALRRPLLPDAPRSRFLNPDFARGLEYRERARALGEALRRSPRSVRAAHYGELTSGLIPAALEVTDRAAAGFGLDVRYPFADRRLVEFCLGLPPTQRFRGGVTRVVARRAMRGYLPEPVRSRNTKGDLGATLEYSLRTRSRAALQSLFFERLPVAAPYVQVGALQEAYRQFDQGRPAGELRMLFWQVAVLTRWLELEREQENQWQGGYYETSGTRPHPGRVQSAQEGI